MVVGVGLAFLGKAIAEKAVGASLDTVIRNLLQVQDRQLGLLESIHEDVTAMREGPWQRARTQLHVALGVTGQDKRFALVKAANALEEAVGLYPNSAREPSIAAELSVVYAALENRQLTVHWARRSFETAERYLTHTTSEAQQGIRKPLARGDAVRRQVFNLTPPSIEWLWWKNEITSETQLSTLRRGVGSQAAFVPLRLKLRPALEAGQEIPIDRAKMAAALGMRDLNWQQAKTVVWTLELPEIRRLYDAHRMSRHLPEFAGLCRALGGREKAGTLDVDLSTQQNAVVRYLSSAALQ